MHAGALLPWRPGRNHATLDPGNPVELVHPVDSNRQRLALDFARPFRLLLFVLDPKLDLLFERIFLGSIIEQQGNGFVFLSGLRLPRRDGLILAE